MLSSNTGRYFECVFLKMYFLLSNEPNLQSEPDLDDDAMFKFDEALVQVFKNMRKTKEAEAKENKKQLLAFKSR